MSSVTPTRSSTGGSESRSPTASILRWVVGGVRAVSFWAAALLPLAVLFVLATGLVSYQFSAVVGALALNAVCAVVGHGHAPGERP